MTQSEINFNGVTIVLSRQLVSIMMCFITKCLSMDRINSINVANLCNLSCRFDVNSIQFIPLGTDTHNFANRK